MMGHKNGRKRQLHTLRSLLRGRKGATLVELVITFALIGLFAAGTCQIISTSIKVYHQVRGLNNARQVSDTLLEKITGEIEGAQVGVQYEEAGEDNDGVTLWIKDAGATIDLYDRTGSHIYITSKDQKMVIHYYPVMYDVENETGTSTKETVYKEVDWNFDEGVYMGFKISSLKFARADQSLYPENVIRVDMDLTGGGYGTFHSTRYVECYNFVTDQDFDKIKDDSEGGGGGEVPDPDTPGGDDDDKKEEGFITVDKDDNISFEANSPSFEELREEAKNSGEKVKVPKGIYEEDGVYYIIPVDREMDANEFKGNLNAYCNSESKNGYCYRVDGSRLYTEADIKHSNKSEWAPGCVPEAGNIIRYGGRYYLLTSHNGKEPPANPPENPDSWFDITDFVNESK